MTVKWSNASTRYTTADYHWSVFPETCVGDGLTMAIDLGASTAGLNCGSLQLSTTLIKELEPFRPGWLVFVNREGRRYINEQAPYSVQDKAVWVQGGFAWVVFDDASKCAAAGPFDQRFGSGFWTAGTIDAFAASGDVLRCGSIEERAAEMGVPAAPWLPRFGAKRGMRAQRGQGVLQADSRPAPHPRPAVL